MIAMTFIDIIIIIIVQEDFPTKIHMHPHDYHPYYPQNPQIPHHHQYQLILLFIIILDYIISLLLLYLLDRKSVV